MGLFFLFFNLSSSDLYDSLVFYLKSDSVDKASEFFLKLKEVDSLKIENYLIRAKMASLLGVEPYPVLLLRDGAGTPKFLKKSPLLIVFKELRPPGKIGVYNLASGKEEIIKLTYNKDIYPCFGETQDTIYFLRPRKRGFELKRWIRGEGVKDIDVMKDLLSDTKDMFRFDYENGKLVFEYIDFENDGDYELYLYDFKKDRLERLTDNIYYDRSPRFASENKVVFCSDHVPKDEDIFLMDLVTKEIKSLVGGNEAVDIEPAFAKDKLLYVSDRDGNQEIYLKDFKMGFNIRITYNPGKDIQPDISSDGKWVVFQSEREGHKGLYIFSLAQPVSADSIINLIKERR